jgi:hypothetical protein
MTYLHISDIRGRKAEGRRDIARRSFGEKIAMMGLPPPRTAFPNRFISRSLM